MVKNAFRALSPLFDCWSCNNIHSSWDAPKFKYR